jgi:hypothetical protein
MADVACSPCCSPVCKAFYYLGLEQVLEYLSQQFP